MPRYHRVEDIIQLALALQSPGPGLCLEDVQQRFGVGRRTAERMREAVDRLYPGMTASKGDDGRKYWSLPQGRANALLIWQPEELQALREAIACAERDGEPERVRVLAGLRDKLGAVAAPLGLADERAAAIGPVDPLHRAILEEREVRCLRARPDGERVALEGHPYGLLAGPRPRLVAFHPETGRARLHPVDALSDVVALASGFERDPLLDLRRIAANAFARADPEPVEACWRFAGEAADEALEYEFHEEQQIEHRPGGAVEVRFQAGSLVELAWHLFTWGDRVQDVEPPLDKRRFELMLRRAMEARPLAEGRAQPEARLR